MSCCLALCRYSNFTQVEIPTDLASQDYFLVPEQASGANRSWAEAFGFIGVVPMVYHLGQHHTRVGSEFLPHAGFKPLCLTMYGAALYGCATRSALITPMNDVFLRSVELWASSYSEDWEAKVINVCVVFIFFIQYYPRSGNLHIKLC